MKKLFQFERQSPWFCMLIFSALIGIFIMGCTPPIGDFDKSNNAQLSGITIKGENAGLGTPKSVLGNDIVPGTVAILADADGVTDGTTAHSKASITKIVKFAKNTANYTSLFADAEAYDDEAIADGDFFIFLVTAEDDSKLYYRVNVTIVSFLYTLTASNVDDESNFANVRFFVSDRDDDNEEYTTLMTYNEIAAMFDEGPITAITDAHADMHLYAFEFTGAGSGTLLKYGGPISLKGDEDIVIELEEAYTPLAAFTLSAANVEGESNFANVRFWVLPGFMDEIFNLYNDTTYALLAEEFGSPVTAILDIHEDGYLYALEFTGAGSGTLLRAGVHDELLTGTDADEDIVIELVDAEAPPEPPTAAIQGSPVSITGTVENNTGDGGVEVDEIVTITLENGTVYENIYYDDADDWFSVTVEGLYYEANAEEGDDEITIHIYGTPEETSAAQAEITIPMGYLADVNSGTHIHPVEVSGSVKYNIDQAEMTGLLKASNVGGEGNFANVRFFVSDWYNDDKEYTTLMTYNDIAGMFDEDPVIAINYTHAYMYLYAFEFTGAGSGTLLKAGVWEEELTGITTVEDIVIELESVYSPEAAFTLNASNVEGESNFANVRFWVLPSDFIDMIFDFYNDTPYALLAEGFGNPVTAIYDIDAGKYLYAIEFTEAGSGTLVRAGVHNHTLTGTVADEDIEIELVNAEAPPAALSAEIAGSPITITGMYYSYVDERITITLENATVFSNISNDDVEDWFSETVEGLYYYAFAAAGDTEISINIYGTPYEISTAETEITIPVGTLQDVNGSFYIYPVEAGSISYNIDCEDITDFDFYSYYDSFYLNSSQVSANTSIGSFTNVIGGIGTGLVYSLVNGTGDTDNDSFTISNNYDGGSLRVGSSALTEAKTYSIRVQVEDSAGKTFAKVIEIEVLTEAPPPSAVLNYGDEITATLANDDGDGFVGIGYDSGTQSISIELFEANTASQALAAGADVSDWFSETIPGLDYTLENELGGNYLSIEVSGIPTATISTDDVTITIPAEVLVDSNWQPTITEDIVVEGTISYNVIKAPETAAKIGETKYLTLADAVYAADDDVITIVRDIELSSTISLYSKYITIRAETDGLTISPAAEFTGPFFELPYVGNSGSHLYLGDSSGDNVPVLIIDGKNQVDSLITVGGRKSVYLYDGVELRNASGSGLTLRGQSNYGTADVYMYGGVIAGCDVGVNISRDSCFNMSGGIIYGNDGGMNANSISVVVNLYGSAYPSVCYANMMGEQLTDGSYTQTFGTAP